MRYFAARKQQNIVMKLINVYVYSYYYFTQTR